MDLVDVEGSIEKYETMTACAREAERSGYDSIWLYDHFHTVPIPVSEPVFECWTSMAALARDTSTVANRPDGDVQRLPPARPASQDGEMRDRLSSLAESLQVLKAMGQRTAALFDCDHYRLRGAINEPKPVQKPHPPLWIGGSGEQVTLRLVTRYADASKLGELRSNRNASR